ncbi:hypothetical protein V6N13_116672 [Hibiscus sabdariffa]
MAPKGTCRGHSTRVGQVARAALKRNFHRAAGRILCRRLKYATGYCKWQSGLAATIHSDSALCHFDSSLPPYSLLFLLDQRLGFNCGCIVPTLVKIFPRQPSLIPDVHRFASDSIFCYADKGESHAL